MTLQGTVFNGTIVLDEPPALPDGMRVEVAVSPLEQENSGPTLLSLLKLAGAAKDLPADMAEQHDHYLHGAPKQ